MSNEKKSLFRIECLKLVVTLVYVMKKEDFFFDFKVIQHVLDSSTQSL